MHKWKWWLTIRNNYDYSNIGKIDLFNDNIYDIPWIKTSKSRRSIFNKESIIKEIEKKS